MPHGVALLVQHALVVGWDDDAAFVDVADDADWTAIADGVIGNGHLERTEPAAEGDVLFVRNLLVPENENGM